jgi:hypothetical protein
MLGLNLTDGAKGASAFEGLVPTGEAPAPGVYDHGIVVVPSKDDCDGFLDSWAWLIGEQARCLLTTGFGDVFFWADGWVRWLNVQRGTTEPIDREATWFLTEFLAKDVVIDKMLRQSVLTQLTVRQRSLKYHEAFILEPWLIFGGVDSPESYTVGHCGVYVDLVGQTWPQLRRGSP